MSPWKLHLKSAAPRSSSGVPPCMWQQTPGPLVLYRRIGNAPLNTAIGSSPRSSALAGDGSSGLRESPRPRSSRAPNPAMTATSDNRRAPLPVFGVTPDERLGPRLWGGLLPSPAVSLQGGLTHIPVGVQALAARPMSSDLTTVRTSTQAYRAHANRRPRRARSGQAQASVGHDQRSGGCGLFSGQDGDGFRQPRR